MAKVAPILTPSELQGLRKDLMGITYNEAYTKLLIFRRAQRINGSTNAAIHAAKKQQQRRKSSLTKEKLLKGSLDVDDEEDSMPPEAVLNAIQLDKELTALMKIYTIAYEELKTQSGKTQNKETLKQKIEVNESDTEKPEENKYENGHSEEAHKQQSETASVEEKIVEPPLTDLIEAVEAQKEDKNEEYLSAQQLRESKTTFKALKEQIVKERHDATRRMQQQDERIAELKHGLRNVRRLNGLEFDLVQRWEENRCVQASIVCERAEKALQQQIDEFKQRLAGEQRIIHEVMSFTTKQFEEFRAQIAVWQAKYAKEMSKMEELTNDKEERILELEKTEERHRQTYEQRVEYVREYLELKAEEQRLYEQEMHRVECAVRIQAWWRGVMVRRGLGPYRKKSKKTKKSKAKGK